MRHLQRTWTSVALATIFWVIITSAHVWAGSAVERDVRPPDIKAVWDAERAQRDATPTRERICINGLWRWQPAVENHGKVPEENWGYFKVPGCWPGITDYLQQDCQTVYRHPSWRELKLAQITAAWCECQITIPANWADRRISIAAEYLNSYAVVYLDGSKAGEMRFPGGEVDITSKSRPGSTHRLTMYVASLPLKAVLISFSDTATPKQARGAVARRGLCGDVYLVSTPVGARIDNVRVDTFVRKNRITFTTSLTGLKPGANYTLRAIVSDHGRDVTSFTSDSFDSGGLADGRISFSADWKVAKLWDLDTPQNQYQATVSLIDRRRKVIDTTWPQSFGFGIMHLT